VNSNLLSLLIPAAFFNLIAVYCLKQSKGMVIPWASLTAAVSILITQWLIGIAMQQGTKVLMALTIVAVLVTIGGGLIGWRFSAEKPSGLELVGYAIALVGVLIAGSAKATINS
jgi:multidrug transporter EmrE-like cation transporter